MPLPPPPPPNPPGQWVPRFSDDSPGEVYHLLDLGDGRAIACGAFDKWVSPDGETTITAGNAIAINTSTWVPFSSFAPALDNRANRAISLGGYLYVFGNFTADGMESLGYGAKYSLVDFALQEWDPQCNAEVLDVATDGTLLYIIGQFTSAGGESRSRIAALDSSGAATAWNPGLNPLPWAANAVAWHDGYVYAAGEELAYNHDTEHAGNASLVRFADDGNDLDLTWNLYDQSEDWSLYVEVKGITIDPINGLIWAAGNQRKFSGIFPRQFFAAFSLEDGSLAAFDHGGDSPNSGNGYQVRLSADGSLVYFAFATSGYPPYDDLQPVTGYQVSDSALVFGPRGIDADFTPYPSWEALCLLITDDAIAIGGRKLAYDGMLGSEGFVVFNSSSSSGFVGQLISARP